MRNIATPAVNPQADTQNTAYHSLMYSCVVRKSIPMTLWKYVCTMPAIASEYPAAETAGRHGQSSNILSCSISLSLPWFLMYFSMTCLFPFPLIVDI